MPLLFFVAERDKCVTYPPNPLSVKGAYIDSVVNYGLIPDKSIGVVMPLLFFLCGWRKVACTPASAYNTTEAVQQTLNSLVSV